MPYPIKNQAVRELINIDLYKTPFLRTPTSWYSAIQHKERPYLNAITLLADVVSFYQPHIERREDGSTGTVQQRFIGELLQRSYKQIEEQYGLTKKQARPAYQHLEKMGLLKVIFDTAITSRGKKLGNVMYIQLFPLEVLKVTVGSLSFKLEDEDEDEDDSAETENDLEEEAVEITETEIVLDESETENTPSDLQVTSPPSDLQVTRVIPYRAQALYPTGNNQCTNDTSTNNTSTNDSFAAAGSIPLQEKQIAREISSRAREGDDESDEIWWNVADAWVSRAAVEQVCSDYMTLDDWRDKESVVHDCDTGEILNLLLWLRYAEWNGEHMIKKGIRNMPGYIRARLDDQPPQVSRMDIQDLMSRISKHTDADRIPF